MGAAAVDSDPDRRSQKSPGCRATRSMNAQPSPFEEKKPPLPAEDPPTLPESSDLGFYQDFYQQQPYSAYGYHHYGLNGTGPGGGYPFPQGAYRDALQDGGESSPEVRSNSDLLAQ